MTLENYKAAINDYVGLHGDKIHIKWKKQKLYFNNQADTCKIFTAK